MLLNFFLLLVSLFVLINSANFAIRYSTLLAESLKLPKYIIGFVIVAFISILPETFVSLTAAFEGIPSFGLGTLFGGNVADLTLVFALVVLISGRSLKIESKLIKNKSLHICALLTPIILGLNGYYSRLKGFILILSGLLFYYLILKKSVYDQKVEREKFKVKYLIFLLLSMSGLLLSSHFTVSYGVDIAHGLHVNPILIGMLIIGVGTTLPELLFSIKAAKRHHDDLALGDIMGTVIADATIVIGLMSIINPFSFNPRITYITGSFMVLAAFFLFYLMKTDKKLSKKEAFLLLFFYLIFVLTEFFINK